LSDRYRKKIIELKYDYGWNFGPLNITTLTVKEILQDSICSRPSIEIPPAGSPSMEKSYQKSWRNPAMAIGLWGKG
jgi:hypothetical protein